MGRRENIFKRYLVTKMGTRWDVQSHEDKHTAGIPDLSFGINGRSGWIELKQIEKYGADDRAIIKPQKYTPLQVNWMSKRIRHAGVCCFIFVKVENDYYLFDGTFAKDIASGRTAPWYRIMANHVYEGVIDPEHLADLLTHLLLRLDTCATDRPVV